MLYTRFFEFNILSKHKLFMHYMVREYKSQWEVINPSPPGSLPPSLFPQRMYVYIYYITSIYM